MNVRVRTLPCSSLPLSSDLNTKLYTASSLQMIQMFMSLLVSLSHPALETSRLAEQVYSTLHVSMMIHRLGVCVYYCRVTHEGKSSIKENCIEVEIEKKDWWKMLKNQSRERGHYG